MNEHPYEGILQTCSLHSLLMLTSKALTREGFGDVQILDRRQAKQKSRYGGHELMCETTIGSLPAKVVVKVINEDLRLRMFDELAGVVDRMKADLGILVTPRYVSAKLFGQQESYSRSRIALIDGNGLASLLSKHGIGMRPKGEIDYAFFSSLEEVSDRILTFMHKERRSYA